MLQRNLTPTLPSFRHDQGAVQGLCNDKGDDTDPENGDSFILFGPCSDLGACLCLRTYPTVRSVRVNSATCFGSYPPRLMPRVSQTLVKSLTPCRFFFFVQRREVFLEVGTRFRPADTPVCLKGQKVRRLDVVKCIAPLLENRGSVTRPAAALNASWVLMVS